MANIHFILNQTRRENRDISILAIIETIFFVFLTWFIAYRYNTYTHIYSSILIAPLLLLKTDFSIDKAIEWFFNINNINEDKLKKSKLFWISIITFLLISLSLSYFTIDHFFNFDDFFKYYLIGSIGVAVEISIVVIIGMIIIKGGIGVLEVVIGSLIGILVAIKIGIVASIGIILGLITGVGLGFFIRALIVKFISTLYGIVSYPLRTIKNIPNNFFEQIMINDIDYSPEILPNIYKKKDFLKLSKLIENLKYRDIFGGFLTFFIILIFSLSYLYRWSIKSTAWFYFPLVYIANLQILKDKENQELAIMHQSHSILLHFNVVIGVLLLLYFGVDEKIIIENFKWIQIPIEIINKIPFSIVINSIWLVVASLVLYVVAYYFSSLQAHSKEQLGEVKYTQYNTIIHWVIRLKFMLWYAFFIWNLLYIANVHWLPDLARYM